MGIRVPYQRRRASELPELQNSWDAMDRLLTSESPLRLSVEKGWDGLWFLLNPFRRTHITDEFWEHPASLLGRAVMGGDVLNAAFSATDEDHATP